MNAWPTALLVLLWSSGAIFSRWGLDDASPFVLLALRFGVALVFLWLLGWRERRWLPEPGTRAQWPAPGCCWWAAIRAPTFWRSIRA